MSKSLAFLVSFMVVLTVVIAGCGGGGSTTSTSSSPATTTSITPTTTPTTIISTTTTSTTTPTSTSTLPTTTAGGNTLPSTGVPITTHSAAVLAAYKGLCQTCHGKGLANSNPYPPTWDGKASGSSHNTGVYPITPGSPADHTPYTVDECTKAGCHAVGGSSTSPPTTTKVVLFNDPEPGGKPTPMTFHPLKGFENCIPCHVGSIAEGSNKRVGESHDCDECHATKPVPSFDPGHEGIGSPTLPKQLACVVCHKEAVK
jgi:hypothetical protein